MAKMLDEMGTVTYMFTVHDISLHQRHRQKTLTVYDIS